MSNTLSYQQIVDKIQYFADNHIQVKRFGSDFSEQLPNFATEGEAWPILYVSPIDFLLQGNVNEYILDVYCLDLIQNGRENVTTIVSDCYLILHDLYRWITDGNDLSIDVLSDPNILPLNNYLMDYAAGGVLRLRIQGESYSICDIPGLKE
jgi:hypothetical protein